MAEAPALKKSLGPVTLWGLGVGYVISGEYFGWNLGLPVGGSGGMLVALAIVSVMYVGVIVAYAELACRNPHAGGAFSYAQHAFGGRVGALAGLSQAIEFVFAPPAIALAIAAYAGQRVPDVPTIIPAAFAYLLFTGLNAWGVQQAAVFELFVTVLAVFELVLFAGITLPQIDVTLLTVDPFPSGMAGVVHCLPFAIWFYLGIEGLANAAEEAKDPDRDLPRAFLAALATLLVLAVAVFFGAVGVAGAHGVVFPPGSDQPSDAPLPLALARVVAQDSALYSLLLGIGMLGLIASFHGILLAAGRATMELGRAGFAPRALGRVHAGSGTPRVALVVNMVIGLVAMASGRTEDVITLAVMGALLAYVSSLASLLQLRAQEPARVGTTRVGKGPFRAPLHPWLTIFALVCALGCLFAIASTHPGVALIFGALLGLGLLRAKPARALT